ncbi:MAG: hypothetical protein AAFS11_02675 [Planctomycetota bacterium]
MRSILLVAVACGCFGCSSGARIAATNDSLRLERESQTDRITELEAANAELRAKLAEANARAESPLPDDVIDALPRVAGIELTRFCSIGDGEVKWAIKPTDGRGRFVQVVGTLELRAVAVGAEPSVLAEVVLSPTEVRDAFASGLTGAGYRVSTSFDGDETVPITLTATLHDHVTGATHEASRVVDPR